MPEGRTAGLIVNPTSGRGKAARILPELRARLAALGCDAEVLTSESAAHASQLAAAAADGPEVVVAVGGDGMVAAVAQGVIGSRAALGIVPAGTGNDLAANLGYARRKPLEAAAVIARGDRRPIDVGRIEGSRAFLCVAGGGFDSEVNRDANRIQHLRGTAVYLVAVLRTMRRFTPARFTVTLDGEERSFDGMFVAVGNASSYGGGMRITPDAKMDDGVFDVCMVGAMGKGSLLAQLPRLFTGTHVRHPAVETARARRVTLAADRPFTLYADGEEVGPLPATLTLEPAALDVVAPPRPL